MHSSTPLCHVMLSPRPSCFSCTMLKSLKWSRDEAAKLYLIAYQFVDYYVIHSECGQICNTFFVQDSEKEATKQRISELEEMVTQLKDELAEKVKQHLHNNIILLLVVAKKYHFYGNCWWWFHLSVHRVSLVYHSHPKASLIVSASAILH